jgi:hypothetical protein
MEKHAFQSTRIRAFKLDFYSDEDFLPSELTNRTQGSLNGYITGGTSKELQVTVSSEKNATENKTCANSVVNLPRVMKRNR